jgi:hypothetical protein
MRPGLIMILAAAATVAFAVPSELAAQGPPGSARAKQQQGQKAGPSFCRDGSGHPVFGRQWCREKGFSLGRDRWERQRWDDVILRGSRNRDQRLGGSVLRETLGDVVFGRLERHGRRHGDGAITGRWLDEEGASVLQLLVGTTPFARLVDADGDGRADSVLVLRR